MHIHGTLPGWLILEGLLIAPLLITVFAVALQRWLIRAFSAMPDDTYMTAVFYPLTGGMAGAFFGYSAPKLFIGDIAGLLYLITGIWLVLFSGGTVAKDLAKARSSDTSVADPDSWHQDLVYLVSLKTKFASVAQLSQPDRDILEAKACEATSTGRHLCSEAAKSRFQSYWAGRRQRVRVSAYAWVIAGIYVAVAQSLAAHSWWFIFSLLTGFSWLIALRISWRQECWVQQTNGNVLIEAARALCDELVKVKSAPIPTFRERLSALLFPRV